MKPPKCRMCGSEHWNSEPHVFPNAPSKADVKKEKKPEKYFKPVTSNITSNAKRQQKHREKMKSLGRKPWLVEVTDKERFRLKEELKSLRMSEDKTCR